MRNCHRVGAFSAPEIHSSPTKMVAEKGGFHGDLMVIYSDLSQDLHYKNGGILGLNDDLMRLNGDLMVICWNLIVFLNGDIW